MINGKHIYGLTGGIASGKSLAATYFREAGIPVIDADALAHELSEPNGKAYPLIFQRFGTNNRKKLREIIFLDPKAKKDLEAILHPLIWEEALRQFKALDHKVIIFEAALLVQTGRDKELDGLILVDTYSDLQIKRLISRDGINQPQAQAIIQAQGPKEALRKAATVVIENTGTPAELREKILPLAATLLSSVN